jgi:signal transduction histidine kinase
MLPASGEDVTLRTATLAILVAALLSATTAGLALEGGDPASPIRHLYFAPVVVAALVFGLRGAALAGGAAILLFAPIVLPDVERHGLTFATAEGFLTMILLVTTGGIVGSLRSRTRRQAQRLGVLVAVHEHLAQDLPIELLLRRLRALLIARLPIRDAALVLRDATGLGADGVMRGSVADTVSRTGIPTFLCDTGEEPLPRRVAVVPLVAGGAPIGALVVEADDLSTADRADLITLGAYVGLALENARLAARQRRAAEELDAKVTEATRHLTELDRVRSMFVAVASHELRTPLTALLGFGELLATRRFPESEVKRLASIVHRETERLVRLVDDLLDLSRLERGAAPALRPARVHPARALASIAELFRSASARVVIECDPTIEAIEADPDAVDRILKNLVTNALKYSPVATPVRVSAHPDGPAAVRFTVKDRGPGIPPEALPRVFEPFYRAPGAGETARGTGLGLAVVKALVEAHGGDIEVTSEPGAGTCVSFTLPTRLDTSRVDAVLAT